jgi:phospholipase C
MPGVASLRSWKTLAGALFILAGLACSGARAQDGGPGRARPGERASADTKQLDFDSAIQHIVFIIKENRSFDSYFGTFPNAYGTSTGVISTGQTIPLFHAGDRFPRDFNHSWNGLVQSIDYGRMDAFDLPKQLSCTINGDYLCYSQNYQQDLPNYWAYAQHYVLGDEMFSSETGPSYPQHLYTVAASSGGVIGEATIPSGFSPGCDAPPGVTVAMLSRIGTPYYQYPCFDMPTLGDTLDAAGVSWKAYTDIESQWNGFLSINHVRHSPDWTNNIVKRGHFVTDINANQLPAVSWLIPDNIHSEHPTNGVCLGENWTVDQINAIMNSPYWNNTVIFVTWDDPDGLYDHVPPPSLDEYGLGPRVPLLIISPYAKSGYISHTVYEFASILKFIEERFNLPYLTDRDANANDMLDSFDFNQTPLPPLTLSDRACPIASQSSTSFLPQQVSTTSPSRTILLTNYNPAALTISSITTSGDFAQMNDCGGSLQPYLNGSPPDCTINVTFSPTAAGPEAGTLTITDSDPSSPQVVQLSGSGATVVLSPTLLSFGTEMVGAASAPLTATLSNTGSSPVTINSITTTADYTGTNNCGSSVPSHGNCSISISFAPTTSGRRYGALTVNTSDAGSPQVVNLTGIGTAITLVPSSLSFGNQPVGSASAPQSVIVTNGGSAPLNLASISFVGDMGGVPGGDTADFSQSNDCGSVLGAGASCTINVVFDPTGLAARSATMNINDGLADSPQQVPLSGTGTAPLTAAVPWIQGLAPPSAQPGSPSLQLTVNGAAFATGATVYWNGSPLATTYVSGHSLTATVPALSLAQAGTAIVTVVNPGPGGGSSNAQLFPVALPSGTVTFGRTDVAVGPAPQGVVAADFNGDGVEDLAIANSGTNSLSILLGKGDGTFTAQPSPATGREPVSLAVGDFNNDGELDLAVGNLADNSVEVLLGHGDGTFTAATSATSTVSPVSIVAGDFNEDGNLDVAVANDVEPEVSILLGAGDGTFTPASTPAGEGINPSAVSLGDYDQDGHLDVTEVNNTDLTLVALLGKGDGSFRTEGGTLPATGQNPVATAAGDFNKDGYLDVAVANEAGNTVSVFLGLGNGTFQYGQTYPSGTNPAAIATADLNGDAALDLVTSNGASSTISLWPGDGTGNFGARADFPTGAGPAGVAIADFNGDGRLDVAVANSSDATVSVLLQGPAGGPVVQLVPPSLTFGPQLVKTASAPQVVTLTNTGNQVLTIQAIAISGQNAVDFTQTNNCGTSLAAGNSCTLTVVFMPHSVGSRNASLSFTDNAPGSPQSVPLAGSGTVMQFTPSSLDFGSVQVGRTSALQKIAVKNTGANTVRISSISLGGVNPGDFAIKGTNCSANLGAYASCMVGLTFTPAAKGSRAASLTFTDSGGGSPQTVPLSGTGR